LVFHLELEIKLMKINNGFIGKSNLQNINKKDCHKYHI